MSGIKIVEETKQKEVTFLEDVDPKYISLVKHGANRMPFRVVKEEKGEAQNMLTVQSILLPSGVTVDEIATIKGLEYLSEAKKEKAEKFGEYSRIDQASAARFEDDSLRMLSVGKGWLLAGKLKDGEKSDGLITLGEKEVEKLAALPVPPMDAIVTNVPSQQAAIVFSFRDLYEKELWSMLDIIVGSLSQTAADPKKRKAAILAALDAFKAFMSLSLDAIGDGVVKLEKREQKTKNQGGDMDLFKTKEEFIAAVAEVVDGKITALKDELGKKPDEKDPPPVEPEKDDKKSVTDPPVTEKKDDSDPMKAIVDAVGKLAEKVDGIAKVQEDLGNQLAGSVGSSDGDDDGKVNKEEDEDDVDPKPKSVFRGLLTGKK